MSIAGNQSKITNRDLFAITLRYAMESDLAVERYAKRYKGELTPSLFEKGQKAIFKRLHPELAPKKIGDAATGEHIESELDRRKKHQEHMKDVNKILKQAGILGYARRGEEVKYKEGHTKESVIEKLTKLDGVDEEKAKSLLKPNVMDHVGYQSFELSNNNANIRRYEVQQKRQGRFETEAKAAESAGEQATTHDFDGGKVHLDYDDNRIRIAHESKPSADVIAKLKSNGFRWSPQNKAWQRQLTNAAKYATHSITGVPLEKLTPKADKPAEEPQAPPDRKRDYWKNIESGLNSNGKHKLSDGTVVSYGEGNKVLLTHPDGNVTEKEITPELMKKAGTKYQLTLARHIATEYIKSKYSNAFEPVLLEQYAEPSSTYVDDGDLLYDPIREQYASALSCLIERYDWNSSKHPRDARGRFTKTRELAEHPTLQAHHSLNIKNQAPAMGLKLKDYRSGFNNLLSNAARAATFKNADPKFLPTEEDIWANVDKQALQKMLADINAADKQSMAGEGPKLHELFNANQIIPRMIAERLHGGSRFFDPEKLRGRWNEPSPESKPEQSKMDKLLGGNDLPAFKPQLLDKPQEPAQAPTQAEPQQPEQQPEQVDAPMPARSNRPGGKLSPRMLESATMKTVLDPEALNPEPSQASEPTPTKPQPEAPAKPKRAAKPKPDRSETGGLSKAMHNKVTKAIADLIGGDNPEMIEAFRPVLMDAWNRKTQEVVQHNQAVRTATAGKSPGVIMNMVKNARNKTLDPAKKKNFDTMVDGFERGPFGYMLNGRGEDGMIELLAEGIKPLPTVLDPDVASDAVTMAGPDFFGAYDQGEVPSETSNEWDAVPFSWAAAKAIVERYRREAKVERYASKAKKQKSCTMLTLSKSDAKPIVQFGESIPKSDLYESLDKEWCDGPLEKESHVTVLYGLTNHNVEPVLEKISGFGSVTVTLGKIAIFSSEKYDVLKIDVDGKRLRELNEKLRELPHESDFPDYKPHLTIAYLKKGSGAAYVGDDRFDGKEITFDSMTFSPPKEIRESAGKPELSLIGSNEKYSQTTCDGFIRELLAQKEKLVPVIANRAIEMLIERRRYAPTLIS